MVVGGMAAAEWLPLPRLPMLRFLVVVVAVSEVVVVVAQRLFLCLEGFPARFPVGEFRRETAGGEGGWTRVSVIERT